MIIFFSASQDALKVMGVTHSVNKSVMVADLTDVTSSDTYKDEEDEKEEEGKEGKEG